MTKKELVSAIQAVSLAINDKILNDPSGLSLEQLAFQYGKEISRKTHMRSVINCVDWKKLMKLITEGEKSQENQSSSFTSI